MSAQKVAKADREQIAQTIASLRAELARARAAARTLATGDSFSTDDWCSPPEITLRLEEFFGGPVDVDPCSNERSIVKARMAMTTGGLTRPWRLPRPVNLAVFENFPYSQGQDWTDKALAELASGNVIELIRLCPMATSTQWWADMCKRCARYNPRVLALKRLAFIGADGKQSMTCRFEPALIYFGGAPESFTRTFAPLTRWATWGRT